MKRIISYFIIISLVVCVGNAEMVSAQAEIRSTVKDMSGTKRKLTIDSVKHVGTKLKYYNYPSEYAQVVDGHYYYIRQTASYRYVVYRDSGKKVGTFKETFQGVGEWYACGWHEGKFYVEYINEADHMITIAMADFKRKIIKIISTCALSSSFDVYTTNLCLYRNKIYAMGSRKVKEFDMSTGKLLNTFSFPKLGKNESMNFINIADGKIYYAIAQGKGKKRIVTFRCRDTETNRDKKVFRCNGSGENYYVNTLMMKGKEIYYYDEYGAYDYRRVIVYSIPSTGGKMQQIGKGVIRDFAYNSKYYFYIDRKHRLHRQNRKTGRDKIISGIKATKVDCTKKGLYVQKYDKWFDSGGYEDAFADYSYALYFMNFKGGNVKKIAKYTMGHMSYYGWWD